MSLELALPSIPLFRRATKFARQSTSPAINDVRTGKSHTYLDLLYATAKVRHALLGGTSQGDLNGERIAILFPSGFGYVVCLWAIWAAGGIAVPLCTSHPQAEQASNIEEANVTRLMGHSTFENRARAIAKDDLGLKLWTDEDLTFDNPVLPTHFEIDMSRPGLIIFTSGTTGRPKGAVSSHDTIDAQTSVLVDAWKWSSTDRIYHILPLHHVHGIINALMCALYAGATVEMHPCFDATETWTRWRSTDLPRLTLFMAVPTIYAKLVQAYQALEPTKQALCSEACRDFRLMVSGSASLPTPLCNSWRDISHHVLLERYGMTEIGMGLSQGYALNERIEGTVGFPLPCVEARVMEESVEGSNEWDTDITAERERPGMLYIKGRNVFSGYWGRPEATAAEMTADGWFKTGDIAMRIGKPGYYQILGRKSIDIIKTGGEKVSALEIERELLSSELGISDVAVIGVPDATWGQLVAAVVVLHDSRSLDLKTLRSTMKKRLAVYKVPRRLAIVSELPKNAMGKTTKKELAKCFTLSSS